MRKTIPAALALAAVLPANAQAKPVTRQHARQYERAYRAVARRFGRRAPGRNIVRWNLPHRKATDADVARSLSVLVRMLAPRVRFTPASYTTTPVAQTVASTAAAVTSSVTSAASSLEACIIQHESGGNPQATNGQYGGIGQWSPTAWAQDGGTRYASSPTGASYAQQQQVLSSEGSSGMQSQQGQFDGC